MYCTILCTKEEGCIGTKAEGGSCHLYKNAIGGLMIDESSQTSSRVWLRFVNIWHQWHNTYNKVILSFFRHNVAECNILKCSLKSKISKDISKRKFYFQNWEEEGPSHEARCQQAGTNLGRIIFYNVYSNTILFTRLNPDESHDYCNRQSEFNDDPKSDMYSILDKMEQFRDILKKEQKINKYPWGASNYIYFSS